MRGEDGGESGPFHQRAVFGPADRGIVGVGPQKGVGETCEDRVVSLLIRAADIFRETFGPGGEGGVPQMADQGDDRVLGQLAEIHAAGDGEREQQNGIAERVFLNSRAQSRRQFQQFLGEEGGRVRGWDIGHGRRMARIVRCSKGCAACWLIVPRAIRRPIVARQPMIWSGTWGPPLFRIRYQSGEAPQLNAHEFPQPGVRGVVATGLVPDHVNRQRR